MKLQLSFLVKCPDSGIQKSVTCEPVWAYEAELHASDLILGYPFLQGFGMLVDPVDNCLSLRPVPSGLTLVSGYEKKSV